MVRAPEAAQPPEAQVMAERNRRKKLAFSKKMLSDSASKAQTQLGPSKTVLKHHGKDIIKKSQRKNRYLFSFPGLLAPIAGGKIGELKDLGTKNPILYLDFPQGQMKLFGTIVYPKNRYLTLHFSRGGKNVMCEDYFDCMIVFSDAWWIGRKEDNPEEVRLDFPTEMTQEQHVEHDFQGGAGGISVDKPVVNRSGRKRLKEDSPEIELQDDESDGENKSKATMEVTPVRHSVRNAGKRFRYTEASPEDDSNGGDVAQDAEEAEDGNSLLLDEFNAVESADRVDRSQQHTVAKSKKLLVTSVTQSMETAESSQSSLVQSTIATLFKKAGEKKAPKDLKKSPRTKGGKSMTKKQGPEVEDEDEIEEMSSSSEDTDGSREEWTA